MDKISKEKRSKNMSKIKSHDTSIEIKVRKYLFSQGFRYRKNVKSLPGKPDIVLSKYKTVIFINGCFWHRHPGCKYATTPSSHQEFWQKKFTANVKNDQKNHKLLTESGWNVIVLWECEIEHDFVNLMTNLIKELHSRLPVIPDNSRF
ncbi:MULTISPECIES: very short patch repair endonuclease [unclassified Megasphaera]|jgi:DNA mismatch endonuclease (patch repair protein)|uniref:very short patch repair endonuclease n=1 Tax=unclassified Megasphaera TaxID=2626256 RepID=UPI000357B56B|nr:MULTISPECIES: very short patch repair endonuclease [unclassified Megasphaera]EPP15088.1 DNA mismatch endonuclease Vsr [Megasphaera sp. BL7]EPP15879.1 DNA mismatch endonuclease Vsr [Megasphaera sp. NM10]